MSVEKVREYLKPYGVADRMAEVELSSLAPVELVAGDEFIFVFDAFRDDFVEVVFDSASNKLV